MSDADPRDEIRAAITFYEDRGWDWLPLVEYILWRERGSR